VKGELLDSSNEMVRGTGIEFVLGRRYIAPADPTCAQAPARRKVLQISHCARPGAATARVVGHSRHHDHDPHQPIGSDIIVADLVHSRPRDSNCKSLGSR